MAKQRRPARPRRGHVDYHLLVLTVWTYCRGKYGDPAERRGVFCDITKPECPPVTDGVAAGIKVRGYG